MEDLRIGIIGCGVMGEHYARVTTDCSFTTLAAACDLNQGTLGDFRERWGAEAAFPDHTAMIASGGLDAVIVATPDFAHRQPVCDCLAAGLPVLCEKPLATTIDDADAIVNARRDSGQPLMVNFGNRHRANARRARELIESGELGRIQHVYMRLNERLCKTETIPWLQRTSPVWFLLSHCVDLIRWLIDDEFAGVYAQATYGVVDKLAPGVPDICSALCTTARGVSVSLESSWIMPDAYFGNIDCALQVMGEQGVIQVDLFPHDLQLHCADSAMVEDYSMDVVLPSGRFAGWWEESTRSFFHALVDDDLPSPTAEEGREVTRTLLAIDLSLEEGRRVALGEV